MLRDIFVSRSSVCPDSVLAIPSLRGTEPVPRKARLVWGSTVTTPHSRRVVRHLFAVVAFVAVLSLSCVGAQPRIDKVEPPNWWTGFVSPVMVLLYGENLNDAKIS